MRLLPSKIFSTDYMLIEANKTRIRQMVETNECLENQFAGLIHHKKIGGAEYTVGLGIGTVTVSENNASIDRGTAALELRNRARASSGLDTLEARVDFYKNAAGEITMRLMGGTWKDTSGETYKGYTGDIIVGNDGIYAKWGTKAAKKIT